MIVTDYINCCNSIIGKIRKQFYNSASLEIKKFLNEIKNDEYFIAELGSDSEISNIFGLVIGALEKEDYILCGDYFESLLLPWFMAKVVALDEIVSGNYSLETTSSGLYTLKYLPGDFYMHSNNNPYNEAQTLVDTLISKNKIKYAVWGLGFGYHIKALWDATQGAAQIIVFEPDNELIEFTSEYSECIKSIINEITIINDPNFMKYAEYLSSNECEIMMHYPSIKRYDGTEIGVIIKRFYSAWNGMHEYGNKINSNFWRNLEKCEDSIDTIHDDIANKKIVVVAAGPSLDDRLTDLLKYSLEEEVRIICVSRVLRKLLLNGITPDYVAILDSDDSTYSHFNGINKDDYTLLVGSTAYWKIASEYKGKKIIAFQEGYEYAEAKCREKKSILLDTGGTVTSLAIDTAVKLGAKKIILVGVDLSYYSGKSHVDSKVSYVNNNSLIMVKGVNEFDVYTDERMLSYKIWIENEIKRNPTVEFINLSPYGAYIEGCKHVDECYSSTSSQSPLSCKS